MDLHQMRALHQFIDFGLLQKFVPFFAVIHIPLTDSHPSFVQGIVVSARALVVRLIANKVPKTIKFNFFMFSPFVYGLLKPFSPY